MTHLKKHNVFYINIELLTKQFENGVKIDYQHLGIELDGNYPLCKLMFKNHTRSGKNLMVDSSLYEESRKKVIDVIISDYIIQKKQLGRSEITIKGQIERIIKFLHFADLNGHKILTSLSDSKKVLDYYILYLKERVRSGSLSQATSYQLSMGSINFLKAYYNEDISTFIMA